MPTAETPWTRAIGRVLAVGVVGVRRCDAIDSRTGRGAELGDLLAQALDAALLVDARSDGSVLAARVDAWATDAMNEPDTAAVVLTVGSGVHLAAALTSRAEVDQEHTAITLYGAHGVIRIAGPEPTARVTNRHGVRSLRLPTPLTDARREPSVRASMIARSLLTGARARTVDDRWVIRRATPAGSMVSIAGVDVACQRAAASQMTFRELRAPWAR
ncbi:putative dehydrogenase [Microbacterium terrae]|nr:hypothetical protein [Microbacterium terrae]MBP1079503.1 putative dehydrogenase [Microbacterium terrae]